MKLTKAESGRLKEAQRIEKNRKAEIKRLQKISAIKSKTDLYKTKTKLHKAKKLFRSKGRRKTAGSGISLSKLFR